MNNLTEELMDERPDREPVLTEGNSKSAYKPTNQEVFREHRIEIQFLSRGGIVNIGCKSIPFESSENMILALQEYFNNPYETQEKWRKILV